MVPPPYADDSFDLVYAISVFTHLTQDVAVAWAAEMRRVLRPGGMFFFTTRGALRRSELDERQRAAFDTGEPVVKFGYAEGTNVCSAYHPRAFVESHLMREFDLLECDERPHADSASAADAASRPLSRSEVSPDAVICRVSN
jgi:SAM-dependent methyltransferase